MAAVSGGHSTTPTKHGLVGILGILRGPQTKADLDLGRPDGRALLEHQRALAQRMHGDAANRVGRAGGTEFHAAFSFASSFGLSCGMRKVAVISAMMATAISDGDTAPMFSPIGA